MAKLEVGTFLYEGINKNGNRVKGEITEKNLVSAKAQLRRQGVNVTKIKKKPKSLFGGGNKKIKPKDIAFLTRQLATMIKSGVPLMQSFEIISRGHDNPAMATLTNELKSSLETGSSLTQALRKHPKYFDNLYCNLVDAGEQSGTLETMLHRIATYLEKIESIKGKIKKALWYPAAVILVAIAVTIILLVKVVPTFKELFEDAGQKLPAITQLTVDASNFMSSYWWVIVVGFIAFVLFVMHLHKTSIKFRYQVARLSIRAPILGPIMEQAVIARFTRTLATTFAAGIPLLDALDSVANACGNLLFRDAILAAKSDAASGQPLQLALQATAMFPNMVIQMIAIGEEAGSLETMLNKIADFYEEQVDNAIDSLTSILEPLIIVFIGGIIGFLVVAMYLPIFSMGQAF